MVSWSMCGRAVSLLFPQNRLLCSSPSTIGTLLRRQTISNVIIFNKGIATKATTARMSNIIGPTARASAPNTMWTVFVRGFRSSCTRRSPAKEAPIQRTLEKYKSVERRYEWHGINVVRYAATIALSVVMIGGFLWLGREPIRDNLSLEIATTATKSLENQEMVAKANEVTKEMLIALLNDRETMQSATRFVTELFSQPQTRQATAQLLIYVMKDPECLKQTQLFTRWVVEWLGKDKTTQENLTKLILYVIHRPDTHAALVTLFKGILEDPITRKQVAQLMADMLQYENVRKAAEDIGVETSHRVLNNEGVKEHAVNFFKGTFSSKDLQEKAGSALWSAVGYGITPRFLMKNSTNKHNNKGNDSENGNENDNKGINNNSNEDGDKIEVVGDNTTENKIAAGEQEKGGGSVGGENEEGNGKRATGVDNKETPSPASTTTDINTHNKKKESEKAAPAHTIEVEFVGDRSHGVAVYKSTPLNKPSTSPTSPPPHEDNEQQQQQQKEHNNKSKKKTDWMEGDGKYYGVTFHDETEGGEKITVTPLTNANKT
eukprot:m.97762 g.97762  ORF g.97762 m.97762 type:complete len:547 (-) comp12502_c0_seq1:124-1764(-)